MYLWISWMKLCSSCSIDMYTCWGTLLCKNLSTLMKWPLARVQVSTCTFWSFDLTAWLDLFSRFQMCFYFVNDDFQSVQNSNLANFRLWNIKMNWFLSFMHPFNKIKSYAWCRRQMQATYVIKMSKSPSGHLHACKCPESNFALLTCPGWISLFVLSPYVISHLHASLFMSEMADFVKNVFFCVFLPNFQFWCSFPIKVISNPNFKSTQMMYRLLAMFGISFGQFWAGGHLHACKCPEAENVEFPKTEFCRF